jgi:hypothetical protein
LEQDDIPRVLVTRTVMNLSMVILADAVYSKWVVAGGTKTKTLSSSFIAVFPCGLIQVSSAIHSIYTALALMFRYWVNYKNEE